MAAVTDQNATQIVLPDPAPIRQMPPARYVGTLPPWRPIQAFAPAWFYSALNWLGTSYYDANNAQQWFGSFLVGSDVDPYSALGSTRLFMIFRTVDVFRLTLAADVNSMAPMSGGTRYPNTDDGIRQMYLDLSATPIFASVKRCYIPGQIAPFAEAAYGVGGFRSGYDPATGLRAIVLGSAVSQIVPLDDFLQTSNEQIYNDQPAIVPLVSALVYDVTQYNTLGATTFILPVYYARDQVTPGTDYVNRFDATTTVNGASVHCGQTVAFPGSPGYNDAAATALTVETTAVVTFGGHTFTDYVFDTARVATISTFSPRVETGIMSLTCTAASPASAFANQQIIGFFRETMWRTSLGVPIYDFGASNGSFQAATVALNAPTIVYDPTHPFLNGGTLQNVAQSLASATYLYSTDRLVALLDAAIAARSTDSGAGLSVTSAALDFDLSSTPAARIVDHLAVPVIVTVTTTPVTRTPIRDAAVASGTALAANTAVSGNIGVSGSAGSGLQQIIGAGANIPAAVQLAPVTIQVGLSAAVPREALAGTGISDIEIGTVFQRQNIGSGAAFEAVAATVINLMARAQPALAPYDFVIASAGVAFTSGVAYVLSVTGTALTVRGSDGSSASGVLAAASAPDPSHTFVGAMLYSSTTSSVPLYPKLQLTLPAPAVGTHGVLQGTLYSVRLTIGTGSSLYDILDPTQTVVGSDISATTPTPTDKSTPQPGDLYFGSFIGGASEMTVWSLPVFLTTGPSQLPGASFNGTMVFGAQASGLPDYQLQITDSSLFVYSNINVDTSAIGSLSASNVFLASAVINSAPDDTSPKAFAPSKLVMGLVRQARMGTISAYVFVPEDDSIVIGGVRYMVSIVNLDAIGFDPNSLPYPPVFWPSIQYWQFANRHNPYLGVRYTGSDQAARVNQAQTDTITIGVRAAQAQEPMQMYLDTQAGEMTVWPIYAFPYATSDRSVDLGQLKQITTNILALLAASATTGVATTPVASGLTLINVPGSLQQANPYTSDAATGEAATSTTNATITAVTPRTVLSGLTVTNLAPNFIANTSVDGLSARQSLQSLQAQQSAVDLATTKSLAPVVTVTQAQEPTTAGLTTNYARRSYQPIYGFSVYNPGTGEAYIVELVGSDLTPPNQLPGPTQNATYDPYYVRVVFLNTLTCYNMSIIVPSIVYDQYGHIAQEGQTYQNLLNGTNEFDLGYMYSLYNSSDNFGTLTFTPWPQLPFFIPTFADATLYTNFPYSTTQTSIFNPISLFGQISSSLLTVFGPAEVARDVAIKGNTVSIDPSLITFQVPPLPRPYFVCRRQNWSADCHLMQATQPANTSVYLAFGAGDLVPFRLDAAFEADKRLPSHMNKLTYTFADRKYDSAKTISVANQPYFVGVTTNGGVTSYTSFSINGAAGTADLQISSNQPLQFPTDCYVVGQASTTLISITDVNTLAHTALNDTGDFMNFDGQGNVSPHQEFHLITYNNLVYLIRAVANVPALGVVGGLGAVSGLLVDTFVPTKAGNLALAQSARYKRSGLSFFGDLYTPTTMIDSLDTLDFTSITGETFYAPTIFIPIADIDADKGFVADLSNFLGQQIWTLIYPEIVAQAQTTVGGVLYPTGHNIDMTGKPILSVQKLHFVYDPLAVMFTPNDLTHKYALLPKQQILALTNGQIEEGICWRSANPQPERDPPTNICAQQILPSGWGMDRPNIIYSPQNRPVITPISNDYTGMSVHRIRSLAGVVYNIEESALSSALTNDAAGSSFISAVSSVANMLIGVLFEYDNDDLGTLSPYQAKESTKGVVFINGYLGVSGYAFPAPIISMSMTYCHARSRCSSRSPVSWGGMSPSMTWTPACLASSGAWPMTPSPLLGCPTTFPMSLLR